MFYDKYIMLCKQKGVNPTTASIEMGFSKATPSKWKKSGSDPRGKSLKVIAKYFGVDESYLLEDEFIQPTFSSAELRLVELFRLADAHDKETIMHILDRYSQDTSLSLASLAVNE